MSLGKNMAAKGL